ncbi:MAG TPA: hypothetical protein VL688_00485 [Verrucomicrobiae bacterium]|jgi:hypothetical protein|nr:hypothetical protein [Verrucomicrobiae bacterium]
MKPLWEDLVQDFLEIGCRLNKNETESALNALREEAPEGEEIYMHPAFSVGGKIMVVVRHSHLKECFFYFAGEGKTVKQALDAVYK